MIILHGTQGGSVARWDFFLIPLALWWEPQGLWFWNFPLEPWWVSHQRLLFSYCIRSCDSLKHAFNTREAWPRDLMRRELATDSRVEMRASTWETVKEEESIARNWNWNKLRHRVSTSSLHINKSDFTDAKMLESMELDVPMWIVHRVALGTFSPARADDILWTQYLQQQCWVWPQFDMFKPDFPSRLYMLLYITSNSHTCLAAVKTPLYCGVISDLMYSCNCIIALNSFCSAHRSLVLGSTKQLASGWVRQNSPVLIRQERI